MTLKEQVRNYQSAKDILTVKNKIIKQLPELHCWENGYNPHFTSSEDEIVIGRYYGYSLVLKK